MRVFNGQCPEVGGILPTSHACTCMRVHTYVHALPRAKGRKVEETGLLPKQSQETWRPRGECAAGWGDPCRPLLNLSSTEGPPLSYVSQLYNRQGTHSAPLCPTSLPPATTVLTKLTCQSLELVTWVVATVRSTGLGWPLFLPMPGCSPEGAGC